MNERKCDGPPTVFITGVSSGIGAGLAENYLELGCQVFGVSRREPRDLLERERFHFESLDLADANNIALKIDSLLSSVGTLDIAVLNAGILGQFGDLALATPEQIREVMDVNVWANKHVIDALFTAERIVRQVVVISSGASVNGNRGWGAYSISKAAVNMLTKLYAKEHPSAHFTAFAPGLVDTEMQDVICGLPIKEKYPSLEVIRGKRNTADMPTPGAVAARFVKVFRKLPDLVESGDYADIRQTPLCDLDQEHA